MGAKFEGVSGIGRAKPETVAEVGEAKPIMESGVRGVTPGAVADTEGAGGAGDKLGLTMVVKARKGIDESKI